MNDISIRFDDKYIAEQVQKVSGKFIPVKSGPIRRRLVRKLHYSKLYPNPDDEFCIPGIGPNYEIISHYTHMCKSASRKGVAVFEEPLLVERLYPYGYMILNGHHRWGAALRAGCTKLPVRIVNMTTDRDVHDVIEKSTNHQRVTLDLDEVVFLNTNDKLLKRERAPYLIISRNAKLRPGIPVLFKYLSEKHYDIWIYSRGYYSLNHLKRYFKHYNVHVDGIVTGIKIGRRNGARQKKLHELMAGHYSKTVHIGNDTLFYTEKGSGDFKEFKLKPNPEDWLDSVIEAVSQLTDDYVN